MAVVLGLLVALCYGTGDFLGGVASKRQSAVTVVVASQASGLVFVAALLLLDRGGEPTAGDLALGAFSGGIGLLGVLLLYRGLAVGRMGVVAPITAVGAAVLPLVAGLLGGERPSATALLGVTGTLLAVVLVARTRPDEHAASARREVALALAAGAAFGAVFIVLDATGEGSGFWPLLGARGTSVAVLGTVAMLRRLPVMPVAGSAWVVVGAGLLDVGANAVYLLGVREGLLSLVSVLASLYPAATVLLARIVLGERLVRPQLVGLGLGLAGVALIAAG